MRTFLLAAALCALTGLAFAAEKPDDTKSLLPSRERIDKLLKDSGVAPIHIPDASITTREFERRMAEWMKRKFLPTIEKELDGTLADQAKMDVVMKMLTLWVKRDFGSEAEKLAQKLDEIASTEANAPVLQAFAGNLFDSIGNRDAARRRWQIAVEKLNPANATALPGAIAATNLIATGGKGAELDRRYFDFLKAALSAEQCGKDDAPFVAVVLLHKVDDSVRKERAAKLAGMYRESGAPEWLRLLMEGVCEVDLAWEARSGKVAAAVSEAGWKGFEEHLVVAREKLTNAWKLQPDNPEAAAQMIAVAMGGHAAPGETMRLWFDRAVAAQCDHATAYGKLLWGMQERWGGSNAQLLAFGLACVRTERWDTGVPGYFPLALRTVAKETGDWRSLFANEDLARLLALVRREELKRATTDELPYYQCVSGIEAWMTGDYKTAAEQFERFRNPGPKPTYDFPRGAKRYAIELGFDAFDALRESRVMASKWKDAYIRIKKARDDGDITSAAREAGEVLKDPDVENYSLLKALGKLTTFENDLAAGKWIAFPIEPLCWTHPDGVWETQSGELRVTTSGDYMAHSFFRGKLGSQYEVRGKVRLPAAGSGVAKVAFGTAFGKPAHTINADWVETYLFTSDRKKGQASLGTKMMLGAGRGKLDVKPNLPEGDIPFRVRRDGDKISWWIGDTLVADEKKVAGEMPDGEDAFGIVARTFAAKQPMIFLELQARMLGKGD